MSIYPPAVQKCDLEETTDMDLSSPSGQLRKSKSSKLGASYKTTLSLHHEGNTNTALQTSFFSSLLSLALSLTSSALF